MIQDHRFDHLRKAPRSYYTVANDVVMRQLHATAELRQAIQSAKQGKVALLAVWTGRYNSDLFFIDDINSIESAGI